MRTFKLKFDIPEHEATQWGETEFISERLKEVKDKIDAGVPYGVIRDINGNPLGSFEVVDY